MTITDLAAARRHHAALTEIFARHAGQAPNYRALRRVLALCQAASYAIDDAYCREKLRLVGEYAAELLSRSEHAKWGRDAMSGAEFLRQQVLNALELFASRLYSIEALRRVRDGEGKPWKTRSGFAPS
jgi:hypothetical protein